MDIRELQQKSLRWLVTGAAGFIGSHLVQQLLANNQTVVGLDNLSTGRKENLTDVQDSVSVDVWKKFSFIKADARDVGVVAEAMRGVDVVLHQAAISSVVFANENPQETFANNTNSLVNILANAEKSGVRRVVYASSAAVYGETKQMPVKEDLHLVPISLYGHTKKVNEETAALYAHQLAVTGLRYFNVFGPRQSPNSAYAGVISVFSENIAKGKPLRIFGDGKTSRDFVFVSDIVRANILAALSEEKLGSRILNVATGKSTSLLDLVSALVRAQGKTQAPEISFEPFRKGDIRYSLADISLAKKAIGYMPEVGLEAGLKIFCSGSGA